MKKIEFYRILSKLDKSGKNNLKLEQYRTDIGAAYELMEFVDSQTGIRGKNIADVGCGNGILGISAAVWGAEKVDLYDIDTRAVTSAENNISLLRLENAAALCMDLFDIRDKYDIAISNPPFGFQSNFSLAAFIKKIKSMAGDIFFIYKNNKEIRKIADENGLSVHDMGGIKLEKSLPFHKKNYYILPTVIVYGLK